MSNASLASEQLSDVERAELRNLIERDGEVRLSTRIGVARNTLGRLVGGLRTNRTTATCARLVLAQER